MIKPTWMQKKTARSIRENGANCGRFKNEIQLTIIPICIYPMNKKAWMGHLKKLGKVSKKKLRDCKKENAGQ
jgi:hypothetical protein